MGLLIVHWVLGLGIGVWIRRLGLGIRIWDWQRVKVCHSQIKLVFMIIRRRVCDFYLKIEIGDCGLGLVIEIRH